MMSKKRGILVGRMQPVHNGHVEVKIGRAHV